jgi:hypothetical protein
VVAAAVIGAVAIVPPALDNDGSRPPAVTQPGPFAEARPTYAVGSTIHYGGDVLRLRNQVRSFVQTDSGFVYTAPDGQVILTDGTTETPIGETDAQYPRVVGDDTGPYVGWTDPSGAGAPQFVVYDTTTADEVVRTAQGSLPGAAQTDIDTMSAMLAIDRGVAYWHDSEGVKAYDIATGDLSSVKDGADANWLEDVEDGVLAHQSTLHYRGDAGDQRIIVSDDPDATGPGLAPWSHAYLAPDAAHAAVFGGDQPAVLDVATGDDVTPPHPGFSLVYFGQWTDDDSFTLVAFAGQAPTNVNVDLLACSLATNSCEVAAHDISGDGRDPVIAPDLPVG